MLHGRLLTYFDEVAKVGSIRGASERLGIAASSVNRQIIALELELGVELFERMPRKLRLTAAGELLLVHIRQTLRDYRRTRIQLQQLKGTHRGSLTIATMSGVASTLIPRLTTWLHKQHPYVKLSVKVLARDLIPSALTSGEADVGLGYHLPGDASMRLLARVSLPVGVVVSPRHPLARSSSASLGDCVGYRMIIPDRSTTIGVTVAEALERASISADMISETNSTELLKLSASEEDAITFLNTLDASLEVEAGRLVFVSLPINQIGNSELRLVQRRNTHLDSTQSLIVTKLIAMMDEVKAKRGRSQ